MLNSNKERKIIMDMNKIKNEFADTLFKAATTLKNLDKEKINAKVDEAKTSILDFAAGAEKSILEATVSAASEALKRLEAAENKKATQNDDEEQTDIKEYLKERIKTCNENIEAKTRELEGLKSQLEILKLRQEHEEERSTESEDKKTSSLMEGFKKMCSKISFSRRLEDVLGEYDESNEEHVAKIKEIEEDLRKSVHIEIKDEGKAYIAIDSKWKRYFSGFDWR